VKIELPGKVALVTGGTRGIGLEICQAFTAAGAKVALCARDGAKAEETAKELGGGARGYACDVGVAAQVEAFAKAVDKDFGQIDVLVNNAAIVPHFAWNIPRWPLIADMPVEFWDRVVHTNLYGTFFGTKHVIPHMAKRKSGHIINLYGGGGLKPGGAGTYMVTKDGIRTFTRYVAEEVRDSNICVVTFSPRVPIATETAPEEALKRLPGPEILGQGFVLAAQLPMDQSGKCFAHENGKLVDELAREG